MMNFGNLTLLCWNVQCLGDPNKCAVVRDTVRDSRASIFCFQETKLSNISLSKFYAFAPSSFSHFSSIDVINNKGFQFMITNMYGLTDNDRKCNFLQELRIIACMHDLPWILLDDFNILRDIDETTSNNPNTHSIIAFN
jgi:hypothetical protein